MWGSELDFAIDGLDIRFCYRSGTVSHAGFRRLEMKGIVGLAVFALMGAVFTGCGKASCDEAKAMAEAAECGLDAGCLEKLAKKYEHCDE